MVAKILDHNNKELQQGRRRQQRERQKRDQFILAKQICTCITRLFLPTWNFLVNTAQKFSYSKLRYDAFGFNPREFRQDLTN